MKLVLRIERKKLKMMNMIHIIKRSIFITSIALIVCHDFLYSIRIAWNMTLTWLKIIFSSIILTKMNSIYFIFLFYSLLIYLNLYIFVTFRCYCISYFYHILLFLDVCFQICHSFLLHLHFLHFFPS